jgi:glutaminyl-peptide cyclotransferase
MTGNSSLMNKALSAALVAVVALLLFMVAGCSHAPGNAVSAQSAPPPAPYLFDKSAAWSDLTAQCAFGPRDPRLPAHAKCEQYILDQLKPSCDQVTTQNFVFKDDARHVTLHLANVFGVINPSGSPRILISGHWDSRPTADNDFDLADRDKPIPGADDGASGVAVLMELARVLHVERPKCCIILGFWDGEDWGPGEDKMYLGSVYFADHPGPLKPDQSILLDMIGQKGLVVDEEAWSQQHFPDTVAAVWHAADEAGQGAVFPTSVGEAIDDDQIPLAKLDVPSIDLIDFDFAYWHTLQDTPDKCDPNSLESVGVTLEQYIRNESAGAK